MIDEEEAKALKKGLNMPKVYFETEEEIKAREEATMKKI